jgi:prepilin-type N-terminal cleavage/methylation domain-containing protein
MIDTKPQRKKQSGFSLIELLVAMTVILVCLAMVSTILHRALGVRARESQRTDALTSAQAAINVISREIANSGFGIYAGSTRTPSNGIVLADSNATRIHFRSNVDNVGPVGGSTVLATNRPGEDVTYFFDAATDSIVRYDPNGTPQTSVVVNRISNVTFEYFNYSGASSTGTSSTTPTADTSRIRMTVSVQLDPVHGQPNPLNVTFTSEVTLRNSKYMLNQY